MDSDESIVLNMLFVEFVEDGDVGVEKRSSFCRIYIMWNVSKCFSVK